MATSHRKIFSRQLSQNSACREQAGVNVLCLQNPFCYYHQQQVITHFCSSLSCTLPLCRQCKQIHLREKTFHNIVSFEEAKAQAVRSLRNRRENIANFNKNLSIEIQQYRSVVIASLDKYLQQSFGQIKMNIDQTLSQSIEKIENGSIKAVIQHYLNKSQQIKFPKYTVASTVHSIDIMNIISKGINILHEIKNIKQSKVASLNRIITECDENIRKPQIQNTLNSQQQHTLAKSSSSQRKLKGISVFGSQRGLSPKNSQQITRSQSLRKIPTPKISSVSSPQEQVRNWKRVINTNTHTSFSRLHIPKYKPNSNNLKLDTQLNNHNESCLTPFELRQICKSKTNNKNQKSKAQINANQTNKCIQDKENVNLTPLGCLQNSENKHKTGSSIHKYNVGNVNKPMTFLVKQFQV